MPSGGHGRSVPGSTPARFALIFAITLPFRPSVLAAGNRLTRPCTGTPTQVSRFLPAVKCSGRQNAVGVYLVYDLENLGHCRMEHLALECTKVLILGVILVGQVSVH